jgi:hypothetical protein
MCHVQKIDNDELSGGNIMFQRRRQQQQHC